MVRYDRVSELSLLVLNCIGAKVAVGCYNAHKQQLHILENCAKFMFWNQIASKPV